jgi:separase
MQLDGTKGFYVLNPSGDLKKTQERFEPWVERMQRAGWTGISGRVPSEVELLKALETKDIVVYV